MAHKQTQTRDTHASSGGHIPPWDFTALDQDVSILRKLQLSPRTHAYIGSYVTALKSDQIDCIKTALSQITRDALDIMEEFNTHIRGNYSIQGAPGNPNDAPKDDTSLPQILEHWRQLYGELVWREREFATSIAGVNCLQGFREVAGVISNNNLSEGDVMAEFTVLFQGLSDIRIPDSGQLEKEMSKQTGIRRSSSGAAMEYEVLLGCDETSTVYSEPMSISSSTLKKKRAKTLGTLAASGIQNGIKTLRNGRSDRDTNGTRTSTRPPSIHSSTTDKLQQVSFDQFGNGEQWQSTPNSVEILGNKILKFIRNSISIFTRVKEMVRYDCLNYIGFISGPQSNDPILRSEEVKRMKDWAQLYEILRQPLLEFASAITTVVGVDVSRSSKGS